MSNIKTYVHSYVSTKQHCDYILVYCAIWVCYWVLGQNTFLNTLLASDTFICCFQIRQ